MASVRIRQDFTVELPDELRGQVQPGDTVEVIAKGNRVSLRVRPAKPIASHKGEYTDEQFHADLKKASKRLDVMEEEALKEDAQGKTRKFPA